MTDLKSRIFKNQEKAEIITEKETFFSRGKLVNFKGKSALYTRLTEKIKVAKEMFYVFYCDSDISCEEEFDLIYKDIKYQKLNAVVIESGGEKIALKIILERCI